MMIRPPGTESAVERVRTGLWCARDGTLFILDLVNGKVRRLDTNGMMPGHSFTVPGRKGILAGRGLWVSDEWKRLAYVASVVRW
jgi:hypothetical protein